MFSTHFSVCDEDVIVTEFYYMRALRARWRVQTPTLRVRGLSSFVFECKTRGRRISSEVTQRSSESVVLE